MSTIPLRKPPLRIMKDTFTTIRPTAFKEQLEDTSDIVVKRKPAPRTKKAMRYAYFDNLENYFVSSGRRMLGRPIQKVLERQLDALKREFKAAVEQEESRISRVVEPLDHNLRTPRTKNAPTLTKDPTPASLHVFPKRDASDIRRSYSRKTPRRSPPKLLPPVVFASGKQRKDPLELHSTKPSDNDSHQASLLATPITKVVTYSTRSRSRSPTKSPGPSYAKTIILTSDQGSVPVELEIPQYSQEISVDGSTIVIQGDTADDVVNANVFDVSDLIQTSGTHLEAKPDETTGEFVICSSSMDDMSGLVVMGEDGVRYRFEAIGNGQYSLVPDDPAQTVQ